MRVFSGESVRGVAAYFSSLVHDSARGDALTLARHQSFIASRLLGGLLAAGVFAAIMNSFDSQVHSVGTMFTQDIVRHYGFHDRMSESKQILVGRLFMVGILISKIRTS